MDYEKKRCSTEMAQLVKAGVWIKDDLQAEQSHVRIWDIPFRD